MADGRRVGQAQRRRIGASPNVYDDVMKPPTFGTGDTVRAKGRYGDQTVIGMAPGITRANGDVDGHGYVVQGGRKGRTSVHLSNELKRMGDLT